MNKALIDMMNGKGLTEVGRWLRPGMVWGSCVLLSAVLTGCGGKKVETEKSDYVKTAVAKRIGDDAELNYSGKTKSANEVNVSFRVSGPIEKVLVKEGDYVQKGQLLAVMDDRDYEVQLAAVQAEYERVKADAERVIAMYQDQSTTASNYDQARYGLRQMEEKLQNCRNQLADTKLYAPMSGYIQSKLHEAGETVSQGMPVVSLFTAGDVEVEVNLPAADYARRGSLTEASCTFDILPGQSFPLEFVRVDREANASQLYPVRFRIRGDYDNHKITPGMSTMVTLSYSSPNEIDGVTVPTSAVLDLEGTDVVYVLDKSKSTVSRRVVNVGTVDLNGNMQIVSGLRPGETVVCAGTRLLTDGQKVVEIQPTSKYNVGGLL